MSVVFRFESLDDRNRATFVVGSIDEAIAHIRNTFDLRNFRMDEDGEKQASFKKIRELLNSPGIVRLYDQAAWHSDDTIEIACA